VPPTVRRSGNGSTMAGLVRRPSRDDPLGEPLHVVRVGHAQHFGSVDALDLVPRMR
jgi:hypothetical protein